MAVRTNILKLVNGELVYCDAADIELIQQEGIHGWVNFGSSVTLDVVATNGNMDSMVDRRYRAGVASLSTRSFAADPADVEAVDTTWDTLSENRVSESDDIYGSFELRFFPLYVNDSGELQTMTKQDFYDTFVAPLVTAWRNGTGTGNFADGGQYQIQEDGADDDDATLTEVSTLPVFKNSIADVNYFADTNLPFGSDEQRDEPVFQTTYKLYRKSTQAYANQPQLLYITTEGEIRGNYYASEVARFMRVALENGTVTGIPQLKYKIFTQAEYDAHTGFIRILGTGMADTDLSSSTRRTQQTGDNYYAQDVPSGVEETRETYYLCMYD